MFTLSLPVALFRFIYLRMDRRAMVVVKNMVDTIKMRLKRLGAGLRNMPSMVIYSRININDVREVFLSTLAGCDIR